MSLEEFSEDDISALKAADKGEGVPKKDVQKANISRLIKSGFLKEFYPITKKGKKAKYPKYSTTEKGRELYKRMMSPLELSKSIISKFESFEGLIQDLVSEFQLLRKSVEGQSVVGVESFESSLGAEDISGRTPVFLDDDKFLSIVRTAYDSVDYRMGDVVPIPHLRKKLIELTGFNSKEIDKRLYSLFVKHRVDLQPGKPRKDEVPLRTDSGAEFYWFKFR